MVKTWYQSDITDYNILARSRITEIGLINDPDASPFPYNAIYLRIQNPGASEGTAPDTRGRLRIQNRFTNNTVVDVLTSDNPFRDVLPPANSHNWYRVALSTTGTDPTVLRSHGAATPSASTLLPDDSEWTYASNRTLDRVNYFWTNND